MHSIHSIHRMCLVCMAMLVLAAAYGTYSPRVSAWSSEGSDPAPGGYKWAKHYAPGLMERVAAKRGLLDTRMDIAGYASVPDCGLIGRVVVVSLYNPRRGTWGRPERLLISDCSHPRDRARHIKQGLGVEVDYQTARRAQFNWDGRRGAGKTRVLIIRFER